MNRKTGEDWKAEIDELHFRRAEAQKLGGDEAVRKHHDQGRLTIRERIGGLVDAGSFQEVGSLTGQGRYDGAQINGITELSQTLRPSRPRSRSCGSTTAIASVPMRHAPTGWCCVLAFAHA